MSALPKLNVTLFSKNCFIFGHKRSNNEYYTKYIYIFSAESMHFKERCNFVWRTGSNFIFKRCYSVYWRRQDTHAHIRKHFMIKMVNNTRRSSNKRNCKYRIVLLPCPSTCTSGTQTASSTIGNWTASALLINLINRDNSACPVTPAHRARRTNFCSYSFLVVVDRPYLLCLQGYL